MAKGKGGKCPGSGQLKGRITMMSPADAKSGAMTNLAKNKGKKGGKK